jgi:hypothetical protein
MAEVWRVEYGERESTQYEDVLVPDGCRATVDNRTFQVTSEVNGACLAEIRLVLSAIRGDLIVTRDTDVPKPPGKVGKLFGRGKV